MKKKKLLSVKALPELPLDRRAVAAKYGDRYDEDAFKFAFWWSRLGIGGGPGSVEHPSREESLKPGGALAKMFVMLLEPRISQAVRTGDGTFLRELADAIECEKEPIDIVRHHIGLMALCQRDRRELEDGWDHTDAEWCAEIQRQTGKSFDIALFRRWADQMGLRRLPDKRGRKPARKLKPGN